MTRSARAVVCSSKLTCCRRPHAGRVVIRLQQLSHVRAQVPRLVSSYLLALHLTLPPTRSNHSAGSCSCIDAAAEAYGDGDDDADGLSLEVVLVLRSHDFPWAVSRIAVIGANERPDSPPPPPEPSPCPPAARGWRRGGGAMMIRSCLRRMIVQVTCDV